MQPENPPPPPTTIPITRLRLPAVGCLSGPGYSSAVWEAVSCSFSSSPPFSIPS